MNTHDRMCNPYDDDRHGLIESRLKRIQYRLIGNCGICSVFAINFRCMYHHDSLTYIGISPLTDTSIPKQNGSVVVGL